MRTHFELGPSNYRLPTEEFAGANDTNDGDATNTATWPQQRPPPQGQQQVLSKTISTVIPGPNHNQAILAGSYNQGEGANDDDATNDAAGLLQLPGPQVLPGPTYDEVQDLLGDLEQLQEMLESNKLPKLLQEALEELQVMAREVEEEMQEATRQPLLGLTIG